MSVQLVMDGHHSFHAAMLAGVEPEFEEQTVRDNDRIALLHRGDVETFLEMHHEDDIYDIRTGRDLF